MLLATEDAHDASRAHAVASAVACPPRLVVVASRRGVVDHVPAAAVANEAHTQVLAIVHGEIDLLAVYLPQLLDEAATRAIVEPLVPECKVIGQLMGRVMKEHKGKVDPGLVRRIAAEAGLN